MRAQAWQLDETQYDLKLSRMPLYAHLDTERHVNNVAVLSFHVEARLHLQMKLFGHGSWFSDDVLLRPRRTVTQFIEQVHYGCEVTCAARLVEVGSDRFRLALAVFQNGRCAGVQECLMGAWRKDHWGALPEPTVVALQASFRPAQPLMPWPESEDGLPATWPIECPVTDRYADLDPDRIVGELALYRYAEQARARPIYALLQAGSGMVIARLDATFYRWGTLEVDSTLPSGIARVGNTSFVLRSLVEAQGSPVVSSDSVLVMYDRVRQRPAPIVGALREKLRPMMLVGA